MTFQNFVLTIVCVLGIAIGQILFKQAARTLVSADGLVAMMTNGWLLLALMIYGGATLLWIYVLRTTPLSFAYPLFALAFIIVPLFSAFVFDEPVRLSYFVGGALIVAGVFISTRQNW